MDNFYSSLFEYIFECYREQRFCDVRLFSGAVTGSGDDHAFVGIPCHSLILCSVAPLFKDLLESVTEDDDGVKSVYLPDLEEVTVRKFLEDVYKGLNEGEFILDITHDLADVFGMLLEDSSKAKSEVVLEEADPIAAETKDEKVFYTLADWQKDKQTWDNERTEKLKRTKLRPRGLTEGPVTGVRSLGHSRMPVVRKLDEGPCKYIKDIEGYFCSDDELGPRLSLNQGTFIASCGSSFASANVTDAKHNTMATDPLKLFRMKLPDSKFVAFLAIGVK